MEQPEQPFQIIISRAFRRLEPLIKLVSPLMKPVNMLVAVLGPTANKEQSRLQALASVENLEIKQTVVLDLPQDRGGRTLLFLQKR